MTDVTADGRTLNLTFTDLKKFKVIVLVCQKSDDSLYASKASFDGAALPAGNNTPTSVPAGIDERPSASSRGTSRSRRRHEGREATTRQRFGFRSRPSNLDVGGADETASPTSLG